MTASKAIELRITRQLLSRQAAGREVAPGLTPAERLIALLAVTAGLFVLGALLRELLWALLAAATVLALGSVRD
ncbi:MAG: hypothetical protein U5K56_03255 [Halioglobus sp.]|nr:hypothetical protein [Halioglobus sp.]